MDFCGDRTLLQLNESGKTSPELRFCLHNMLLPFEGLAASDWPQHADNHDKDNGDEDDWEPKTFFDTVTSCFDIYIYIY